MARYGKASGRRGVRSNARRGNSRSGYSSRGRVRSAAPRSRSYAARGRGSRRASGGGGRTIRIEVVGGGVVNPASRPDLVDIGGQKVVPIRGGARPEKATF